MKETIRPVYQCDHCKKNYLSKYAAGKHEKFCSYAPENKAKCFDCVFLERDTISTRGYVDINSFYCTKMGVGVYPVKAERKGLVSKYPETFEDQIRMPSECSVYKEMEPVF